MAKSSGWTKTRPGVFANNQNQIIFRIGLRGDVEDPQGRYWAAITRYGEHVTADLVNPSKEGIHRFKTMDDAAWWLAVNDQAE